MNLFNDLYEAEKDLNQEYYMKNKAIFSEADKDDVKKIYKLFVSPVTFCVIQGTLMLHFIMYGKNFGNKVSLMGKLFGVTVLNAHLFLYGYKQYKEPTNLYRFCNSFINPMFTLQKDRLIISTISSFIRSKKGNDDKSISNTKNGDNQTLIQKPSQISEGFL